MCCMPYHAVRRKLSIVLVMGRPYGAGLVLAYSLALISSVLLELISNKTLSYVRRWQ